MSFVQELKRRNVIRVGIAYVVIAWLLLQLTEVLKELLGLPDELGRMVVVILAIGFIPTIIFAWAFEMTPEGLKKDSEVDHSQSIAPTTGRKLDRVIIVLLIVGLAYFFWESRYQDRSGESLSSNPSPEVVQGSEGAKPSQAGDQARATEEPSPTSIVVLPFVNMSADPDQEFFSDGLSEEILNALVPIEDLRVISRTSAFAFKDKDLSVPEIAAQLNVSHVLEGSVRTSGDSIRITAQLIEVDTDSHLWSEAYNRTLENVFEVQEEISLAIAEQLELRLSNAQPTGAQTNNMEAYTLYLQGRHFYQNRGEEELLRAEKLLQEAVTLDPDFDEAWATLAATQMVLAFYATDSHEGYLQAASNAAEQALKINPDNGFALAVNGMMAFSQFDYFRALALLDRAIGLSPNESNAYLWKAIVLSSLGHTQSAIAILKQAEAFDPAFHNLHNWLYILYINSGNHENAQYHANMARAIDSDTPLNGYGLSEVFHDDPEGFRQSVLDAGLEPDIESLLLAFGSAYANPEERTAAVQAIQANKPFLEIWGGWVYLFFLGAFDEAVIAHDALKEKGLTLQIVNAYGSFWVPQTQGLLSDPRITQLFKQDGLFAYWQEHGAPDRCEIVADSLKCGAP